ncbi:MAG: hypothetical protein HYW24_01025 [Candidatus Aenigmarchaeota archaeon]|nr:hypothetical protein [Candidatus Aenigmarchaeota archaeon]
MEIVLHFKSENYGKGKDILLRDDVVGRASLTFKEGSIIGESGYYCYLSGTEDQCKRALELVKDLGEEVDDKTKLQFITKVKEEEEKAIEGFGDILG